MSNECYLDNCIGLEQCLVRRLRLERKLRRQQLIDSLSLVQQDDDNMLYPHDSAEQRARTLALVVQDITRPFRLFGAIIAAAAGAS